MSLPPPGLYRHYKGGLYRVICCARLESTGDDMVVYQSQDTDQHIWVRPSSEFADVIEQQGHQVPRFAPLPENK